MCSKSERHQRDDNRLRNVIAGIVFEEVIKRSGLIQAIRFELFHCRGRWSAKVLEVGVDAVVFEGHGLVVVADQELTGVGGVAVEHSLVNAVVPQRTKDGVNFMPIL